MEESDIGSEYNHVVNSSRPSFRLSLIPYSLRFGLAWTLFFAGIGIAIQSIASNDLIINDFFMKNYLEWFRSFGNFSNKIIYPSLEDFFVHLLSKWYYFFYTGGLVSLVWGLLSLIINFEVFFKRSSKPLPPQVIPKTQTRQNIETWLKTGDILLSENRINDARQIYHQISQAYNPVEDPNHEVYNKIIDFYKRLLKKL